jgi:L-threonylcarbamoyladenylate synthase
VIWRAGEPLEPLRELLARGGILGIPTESSYGLAVDPRSALGVSAVYRIKERERGKALPVVAADVAQLAALGVDVAAPGCQLAARVWPAPLTVLLPLAEALPAAAREPALAVRVPDHPPLLALLRAIGPLTATSANRSGEAPLLDAGDVERLLDGEEAVVVDGGLLPGGPPSTLAAFVEGEWQVLRAGRFPLESLPRPS